MQLLLLNMLSFSLSHFWSLPRSSHTSVQQSTSELATDFDGCRLETVLVFISIIIQVCHKALRSSISRIHPYVSCCGTVSIRNSFVHDWQDSRKLKYLHLFANIYFSRHKCLCLLLSLVCCANQRFGFLFFCFLWNQLSETKSNSFI